MNSKLKAILSIAVLGLFAGSIFIGGCTADGEAEADTGASSTETSADEHSHDGGEPHSHDGEAEQATDDSEAPVEEDAGSHTHDDGTTHSHDEDESTDMETAAYRNDDGDLTCPVMGTTIASASDAVSYQDHDGLRYFFCCDACPDQFAADPHMFVD